MTKKTNEPTRIIGIDEEGKPIALPRAPSANIFEHDPEGIPETTERLAAPQRSPFSNAPTLAMPGAYAEQIEPLSDPEPTPAPREIGEDEDEPLTLALETTAKDRAKLARDRLEGIRSQDTDDLITVEGDEPLGTEAAKAEDEIIEGDFVGYAPPPEQPTPVVQKERPPTLAEREAAEDLYKLSARKLELAGFTAMAIVDEFQLASAKDNLVQSLSAIDQSGSHSVEVLQHGKKFEIWIKFNA